MGARTYRVQGYRKEVVERGRLGTGGPLDVGRQVEILDGKIDEIRYLFPAPTSKAKASARSGRQVDEMR